MIDWMIQGALLCLGVSAHFLNQEADGTRARKWAPALGLFAQVFWIAHALRCDPVAWGLLLLVPLYGYGWWRGLRKQWTRPTA